MTCGWCRTTFRHKPFQREKKNMQITLTLNHFIMLFFSGLLAIIIIYAVQNYKSINKDISAITARISGIRERISRVAEKMQQAAADLQSISEALTGKELSCRKKDDRSAIGMVDSVAEFKDALTLLRRGGMLKKKRSFSILRIWR